LCILGMVNCAAMRFMSQRSCRITERRGFIAVLGD